MPQDTEEKEEEEEVYGKNEISRSEGFEESKNNNDSDIEGELGDNSLESRSEKTSNLNESEDHDKKSNFEDQTNN
jgi:hypothetical protein